jgi:hypothetical protein
MTRTGGILYLIIINPEIKILSPVGGMLVFLAGVCYILNSLLVFTVPAFRNTLLPYILILCFVGELSLAINVIAWRPRD